MVAFDVSGVNLANVTSASLILSLKQSPFNWGGSGRPVDAHRLLESFTEGNGWNAANLQGNGAGVTWNCSSDTDISNNQSNCATQWGGGSFAAATAAALTITDQFQGLVSWDVTADVAPAGSVAELAWLIKKQDEGEDGVAEFHSRESAANLGDPALAPRLLLVVTDPNQPPVAADDSALAATAEATILNVLENDSDPENDTLSITNVGTPDNGGSAVANADGTITYTSASSFEGTETFTYTLSDHHGATDVATVTMTVGAPTTTELDAIKDAFIAKGGAKHINNGANEMLRVRASGSNRSLVAFDLSTFSPAGLLRATLVFEVKNALTNWGSGRLVLAHRLLEPWAEGNGFNAGGNVRGYG